MEISIQDLLKKEYLKKFKVMGVVTLFPPDFTLLKENRCILCGNKLKFLKNGKLAICSGKKHKKPFIISLNRLLDVQK